MALDWSNERYVRLYRPSVDHRALCWQARAIWPLLLQEADGAGVLGARKGTAGLARALDFPVEVVDAGVADLLEDGCLVAMPGGYVIRNYVEAQTATMTDSSRKARQREVDRAVAAIASSASDSQAGPHIGHARSREVTDSHDASRSVTPSRAEPSREETHAPRARGPSALAEQLHQVHATEGRKLADSIPGCAGIAVGGGQLVGARLNAVREVVGRWIDEADELGADREAHVLARMARLVAVRAAKARAVGGLKWWAPATFWALDGIERDLAQTPEQAAGTARSTYPRGGGGGGRQNHTAGSEAERLLRELAEAEGSP